MKRFFNWCRSWWELFLMAIWGDAKVVEQERIPPVSGLEPMRRDRWTFSVPFIDAFLLVAIRLPEIGISRTRTMEVTYHNAMGGDINSHCLKMCESGEKFTGTLKFLNRVGGVVEKWTFNDISVESIRWTKLSYDNSEPLQTIVEYCVDPDKIEISCPLDDVKE